VQDCYRLIVENFEIGDEIYIFGFSRGAYAARALAGMIGASGIQRHPGAQESGVAWRHYRAKSETRDRGRPIDTAERINVLVFGTRWAATACPPESTH
jgi:uncharacterized protein (DUF2235 family)